MSSRRERSGSGMNQAARGALLSCALLMLGSCAPERRGSGRLEAEFGVFYGGQVQERRELPLVLDRSRQTHGFRLRMHPPPHGAREVRWEVALPGEGRWQRDSRGRLARPRKARLGRAAWRAGEPVFEQALHFSPGDPVGLWSVRVLLGDSVAIDRPFWVYDAADRARNAPEPFVGDAGG